jgi:cellulose synthase/poly-beta-1,6-N-acetylglucosamine synthase-like glycosyltransferase
VALRGLALDEDDLAARGRHKRRANGPRRQPLSFLRSIARLGPEIRCPEIDCVRHLLPASVAAAAERRARTIGLGADRVLIAQDAITEDVYVTALAESLGLPFERLDQVSRTDCPLTNEDLIQAAASGLLPLHQGGEQVWIIAPRNLTARRMAERKARGPGWPQSFRLTTTERLRHFISFHTQHTAGEIAADGLRRAMPLLSNAPRRGRPPIGRIMAGILAAMFLIVFPQASVEVASAALCPIFLGAALLRLTSAFVRPRAISPRVPLSDDRLPIYTIVCALYREAPVVKNLVAAIRALDYPPEKLDVKLVLEADDHETQAAIADLDLGQPFEIIVAPPIGPRTKPKALNVALPFARGSYTVIYDAEDIPEPDQLRRALDAFRQAEDDRLACVQASLTIDNTDDNWLARMFTANYAGQFDVLLPGFTALRLPFPLGGSSNHFRTAILRKVGGWDPFNVTEDADLGIRLCRFGYRSAAIASATYEEAPAHFGPWLRQRTRWYKGWMQTWLVHMRRPWRLGRELGVIGMVCFQLFLAANVLTALIYPAFMGWFGYTLYRGPATSWASWSEFAFDRTTLVFAATFLLGYASTVVLDIIGLKRRGLLAHAGVLVWTPLHWFLLSYAAWRAFFQLLHDPQRWEKTEHGVAETSRLHRYLRKSSAAASGVRFKLNGATK